jgi:hypothetical protein
MSINVEDYFARATFDKMKAFADKQETPFVVIDTAMISQAYDDLRAGFEFAKVYYAVKANPAVEIIDLLKDKGSSFDIASIYELDKVMDRGVSADRISYGNTIKKSKDIRYFYEKGVRLFSTDSEADLRNIAKAAPQLKELYEAARDHLTGLGDDVQERILKWYIAYRRLKNFATIQLQTQKNSLLMCGCCSIQTASRWRTASRATFAASATTALATWN